MGRTIAAILGGFGVMLGVVMATTIAATAIMLGPPTAGKMPPITVAYLVVNLVSGGVAAVAGGWVCSWIGRPRSLGASLALSAFVLVMSALTAVSDEPSGDTPPRWYPFAVLAIGVLGVQVGGFLERRRVRSGSSSREPAAPPA